jgi:hypothetical protein
MSERKLNEIAPARSLGLRREARASPIRAWREQPMRFEQHHVFTERQTQHSLRKERALSGQSGYDLNRHIRLLKQKKRLPKEGVLRIHEIL